MNAQQTEAQRLADELVALHGYPLSIKAAAELRRLDAELMRKSDAIQRLWAERDSLRASMEHCDRCGKRLGGEGDIHTCTPPGLNLDPTPISGWGQQSIGMGIPSQPEQEPVAWVEQSAIDWLSSDKRGPTAYVKSALFKRKDGLSTTPVYTTPPAAQRQWVSLTNEEIGKAAREAHISFCLGKHQTYEHALTRAVEVKLKDKNNG
ncbi:MAG: hypothetical protein AN484_11965 [Aphanizomenon flos-aquae WA102]|uniref:Uncharacterized protein n=1 Tax=Aphanizomenon flos-aquae WA102 TaxID=1710896 RepID=A0A1B7X2F5_APHFL|nr:MAG: hypothetical protein AN484_11965 [Aphanizomenon flos-aquae WA102]